MKRTPPPRIAPAQLDFVLARVFDMYRELASPARGSRPAPRKAPRRAPRKMAETAE
jgi:hypothetical protein